MEDLSKHNERVCDELFSSLQEGSSVLLVGAGCSEAFGYPGLDKLRATMHSGLAPGITLSSDYLKTFYEMKQAAFKRWGQHTPYARFLRDAFQPQSPFCSDFQCQLVKLNFAGIATTNYDIWPFGTGVMGGGNGGKVICRDHQDRELSLWR